MERDGRKLIVAVMRSAESTERAVNRLFDWGFANYDKIKPVDKLVDPQPEDEITAVPAASYDEQGNSNLPQVAVVESSSAGGSRMPVLLLIATGVAGLDLSFGVAATRASLRRGIATNSAMRSTYANGMSRNFARKRGSGQFGLVDIMSIIGT